MTSARFWGKKVGMTQVFQGNKVVPVTAIDLSHWLVTNIKTVERDGYTAVQVGMVKDRFNQESFNPEWLTEAKRYFYHLREIAFDGDVTSLQVGQPIGFSQLLNSGEFVDVVGKTIGRGFAGVVKRHDFSGPPGSHGSNMGKRPGSSSSYRSQGRIIKNKKFPGHMGTDLQVMKNLEVVSVNKDANVVLVKGSVPGKVGSLLCIRKSVR
ncbi:MAG: 50S ribosomal protein L3 [Candidatus Babeliales bacterium]